MDIPIRNKDIPIPSSLIIPNRDNNCNMGHNTSCPNKKDRKNMDCENGLYDMQNQHFRCHRSNY